MALLVRLVAALILNLYTLVMGFYLTACIVVIGTILYCIGGAIVVVLFDAIKEAW